MSPITTAIFGASGPIAGLIVAQTEVVTSGDNNSTIILALIGAITTLTGVIGWGIKKLLEFAERTISALERNTSALDRHADSESRIIVAVEAAERTRRGE